MFSITDFIPAEYIPTLLNIIYVVVAGIIILIIDRIVLVRLKNLADKIGVPIEVMKSVLFFFRFVLLIVFLLVVASIQLIPSTYFVGATALIGTAIGFGATRAISNFLSGAYLVASGLFRIGDYIRIGSDEGIVVDMTINYTKIKRNDGTTVVYSNSDLLNKTITSFKVLADEEEYYVYPIEIGFDAKTPYDKVKGIGEKIKEAVGGDVRAIKLKIEKITRLDLVLQAIIEVDDAEKIPILKEKILNIVAENL